MPRSLIVIDCVQAYVVILNLNNLSSFLFSLMFVGLLCLWSLFDTLWALLIRRSSWSTVNVLPGTSWWPGGMCPSGGAHVRWATVRTPCELHGSLRKGGQRYELR